MTDRPAAYAALKTALFASLDDLDDLAFALRVFAAGAAAGGEMDVADDVARIALAIARPDGDSREGFDVHDWLDVAGGGDESLRIARTLETRFFMAYDAIDRYLGRTREQ